MMNIHNIKLAIRNLKRHRLYAILSITGFSVGFAICIFIAMFIYNELSMDKCYPDYKNTALVYESKDKSSSLDIKLNQELKEKYPEIIAACPLEQDNFLEMSAKTDKNFTRFTGLISTTNDFFSVFSIKVLVSSGKQPFDGKNSFLITKSFARQLFPDEDPIGKQITVFDILTGKITAVIEDFPENSSFQAKILANAENPEYLLSQNCNDGGCWNPVNHFILLRPGADRTALAKKMSEDFPKNHPAIHSVALQRLEDIYMHHIDGTGNNSGNKSMLIILFSVGVVILVLSTINFLNFYVSMQFSKLKEIGVKKINGADFGQLLRYSLSEVSVSIITSVAIALVLFIIFLPMVNRLFERNLSPGLLLKPSLAVILLTITCLIIAINSVAPLSMLSRFNTSSFLTKMHTKGARQNGRRILTMLQLSVSIVLMTVVFTLYKQISYSKHADLGFPKERLIRLELPIGFKSQDAMKQKLSALSSCQSISLSRGIPGSVHLYMGANQDGKSIMLQSMFVDEDFFKTIGLELAAGRGILTEDKGATCIFNEEAMRQYNWTAFEDKRFNNGREGGFRLVGVVKDFHLESMHEKIKPVCIMAAAPDGHNDLRDISIRLVAGNLGQQMDQLQQVWKTFIPDEPMNFTFYDEVFNAMYTKDEQLSKAIGITSVIALILTFMGILGQVFQISLNRTKEIGVRKVNGATITNILVYMNKEFILWAGIALLLAIPFAWYLTGLWLEGFAYKAFVGWTVYAFSGAIMLIIVTLTVTLQSWKAATRNPVEALRYE